VNKSAVASHLLTTYGPRLSVEEIAKVLRVSKTLVYQGVPGLKTYRDGGKRWADYRDVAAYLDGHRARAEA
jgi:hypothetical protein